MFTTEQYQLLDFGDGRKLERFGGLVVDRPSPAAERSSRAHPTLWPQASGRFVRGKQIGGNWTWAQAPDPNWSVTHENVSFELRATEFGHLGLFPEQARNWDWIAVQLGRDPRPAKVLNLFAYTGGSTLASAAASAGEVVHLDAARNIVNWARRNAVSSGLATSTIRWIVEDARRFVAREQRRKNRYDAIILDPPSYSHGPQGEVWKIQQLPELLDGCAQLLSDECRFVLLTCHSIGLDSEHLSAMMRKALNRRSHGHVESSTMYLETSEGRKLPSGEAVYWLA